MKQQRFGCSAFALQYNINIHYHYYYYTLLYIIRDYYTFMIIYVERQDPQTVQVIGLESGSSICDSEVGLTCSLGSHPLCRRGGVLKRGVPQIIQN